MPAPHTLPNDFRRAVLKNVVITQGAADVIPDFALVPLLASYTAGDWGELDAHDQRQNERALVNQGRVMGAYDVDNTRVWIITDPEWHTTTLLLPEEY